MRRQRKEIDQVLKRTLIDKARLVYGDKCCYCAGLMCFTVNKRNMNDDNVRSLEHIIDYSNKKTNPDDHRNILLSHRKCNSIVGGARLSLEDKEYYIANPHHFIEDFLNGKQIQFNKHSISNTRR